MCEGLARGARLRGIDPDVERQQIGAKFCVISLELEVSQAPLLDLKGVGTLPVNHWGSSNADV